MGNKSIVTRSHAFSRTWRRMGVIAWNFDWLTALFASVVIGQSNSFYDTQLKTTLNNFAISVRYSCFDKGCPTEKHQSVRDNTERHDGLGLFIVASSSSRVFSAMEGGAMKTCLRVLKETKWILSF